MPNIDMVTLLGDLERDREWAFGRAQNKWAIN
jgi:hypothetical protein